MASARWNRRLGGRGLYLFFRDKAHMMMFPSMGRVRVLFQVDICCAGSLF